MRGPGYRHDLDVRRLWHCPHCGKQRRLPGEVTVAACACGQAMQLQEQPPRRPSASQTPVTRELTVASFELTEEELARPVVLRTPPRPRDASLPDPAAPSPTGKSRPGRKPRRSPPPHGESASEPPPSASAPPSSSPSSIESAAEDGFGAGLDDHPASAPVP